MYGRETGEFFSQKENCPSAKEIYYLKGMEPICFQYWEKQEVVN
jgi:hypothetical protein